MKKKPNECDMFVELTIKNAYTHEDAKMHDGKFALTVTSVPNCKESFKLNMDTYFEDLTEEDYLIVWESNLKKDQRMVRAFLIKQGYYKLNKLVMCNERYSDEEEL